MNIPSSWLNTFITLVDTQHFTRTAERLHMTQPGVSQHLKKLEAHCGYTLITRYKQRFDLTRQGRLLYDYAQKLARQEADLLDALGQDNPQQGHCQIACSGSVAMLLYPTLVNFQTANPDISMSLEAAPNEQILKSIDQRQCTLGIVTEKPDKLRFDTQQVGVESLSMVLPASCQLSDHSLPETLYELGLIRHPDLDHYLRLYLTSTTNPELEALDVSRLSTRGYVNQLHQILLPVAQGVGFTVLPHPAVELFSQRERLQVIEQSEQPQQPLYLVARAGIDLPARYEAIIQLIYQSLTP